MFTRMISRTTFAALLCAAVLLTGCNNEADKPTAPSASPPAEVGVVTLQAQSVTLTAELAGRTVPWQIAEVRPQISGIIQKRLFTEGAEVKSGQLLYQIDPASSRAALANAKASLSRAEANLYPVRLKAARFAELLPSHAVSEQDAEAVQGELKQAEAEVAAGQAAVESASINLDYTSVTAPISGRIGRSAVTVGALVTANQGEPLATIQQLDPIYVDVNRSSNEVLQLKRQLAAKTLQSEGGRTPVKLLFEDNSFYAQTGTLAFSDVTVDPGTGNVTLRTVFPNTEELLLPGMFVRAVIAEGVQEGAILVPQRGVTRDPRGNAMALVVGADDLVEARPVTLGRALGDQWLVESGLAAGDRVIIEGVQKARPGSPVKAVAVGSVSPATPPATR
jgi:membrane fusion protein (multidrug efflux system)